jgi:hypothetical protein
MCSVRAADTEDGHWLGRVVDSHQEAVLQLGGWTGAKNSKP